MQENISGIYCIENLVNNKKYIGQAANINIRWTHHRSMLKNKNHDNQYLQNAVTKYGFENFKFWIVEECENNIVILNDKESYYIKFYNSKFDKNGYNLTDGGDGCIGYKHTEESNRKNSEWHKGRPNKYKGVPMSEEFRRKLMGKSHVAWNKGIPMTKEAKEKLSKSKKGKKPWNLGLLMKEESKKKVSESNKGKKLSNDHIEKLVAKIRGEKRINGSSKYVGVCWNKNRNKWCSYITVNKKRKHLGNYFLEEDAARAYNDAALLYFGSDAKLNVIETEMMEV
jgi:group I intron endonuclease